jgi:hypothetical protein
VRLGYTCTLGISPVGSSGGREGLIECPERSGACGNPCDKPTFEDLSALVERIGDLLLVETEIRLCSGDHLSGKMG